ncbi:sigma factor-like helix-turn-helix DNA-binding protein [Streptomyces sp. NPDC059396]|uniref:sigma factor-like helix-turn-helix DNA-binding protein n=1 Tax=Streptomyces sp. NPDC059396 TaxID=3346819 RepID=UPI003698A2EB
MRERRTATDRRRAREREFEAFAAGAAGRLLHAAALLTGEPPEAAPRAERLLIAALARTYADWHRLRDDDPYDHTRQELALRYASTAWHPRRRRRAPAGVLAGLGRQERVVLVLRLYEGVAEEQTAALIGLPVERVHTLCARAIRTMRGNGNGVRSGDRNGNGDRNTPPRPAPRVGDSRVGEARVGEART